MQLYEILTSRRKEIGMSIDTLVEVSRVPKGTVAKILTGVIKNPGIESLKAITYALGLSLEDLNGTPEPGVRDNVAEPKNVTLTFPAHSPEAELIAIYRDLNTEGQDILMGTARGLAMNPDMKKDGGSSAETA